MRSTLKRRTLSIALLIGLMAPAAFASGAFRGARRGAMLERAMERLDLSSEQRARVETVLAEHRGELRQELEAVIASREAQYAAIHGEAFDEAKIRAAAASLGAAQADLAVTRARIANQVRTVLSAEQRARLDDMLETVRALSGRLRDRRERPGR